jgi:hypothetical protein
MTCTRRPNELLVTCIGNQVSWSGWDPNVGQHICVDVRSQSRGPGGHAGTPRPNPEDLFSLWDDSGADAIEERLASLLQLIRSWDWRAATFAEDGTLRQPPTRPTKRPTSRTSAPSGPPAAPRPWTEPPNGPARRRATALAPPFQAPQREVLREPGPDEPRVTPVPVEHPTWHSTPKTRTFVPAPAPPRAPSRVAQPATSIGPPPAVEWTGPVTGPPVPASDEAAPEPSPRRWGKVLLWLVAAVVVIIIVLVIRHSAPGETSGDLTPQTVKSGPSTTTPSAATVQVGSSVLSGFTAASQSLDAANSTVSHLLASGSGQTVATVTQDVAPYIAALEKFDFTMHFVVWPQALQIPTQNLNLRNQALVSFLQSISSETQASLPSWFTQLHAVGAQAETADNLVRKDLGLSTTSSYP